MEGRISSLSLLFLVLSGVGALQVNIPQETYEHARGDNITLPCTFTTLSNKKAVIISWSVEGVQAGAKETLILTHYYPSKVTDIKQKYEGRVSVDVDVAKGKADLKLNRITLEDNKDFECRVQIPGDDEGKPADTARLIVLVAPSIPICKIEGKAEYGQNINLTCFSEEGSPPPTYKWESRDVKNTPRLFAPRTTDKNGILSLFNISKDTSGFYICTSSNKIRAKTCNVTLAVMPPSMNIGSTALIIGLVVLGLIILIVVIYCCCCRKKKEKEEYAMGVREGEYTDKEPTRNGESRHADGQEDPGDHEETRARSPDRYEERSERNYDSRRDYDDRRSDYDDRRTDYNDHRSDYDDRRSDYDDRRSDYKDRRTDYDDRRSDYDDRRSDYSDRRDKYSDRHERYDDRRYDDDRYDEPYDDRRRDGPPTPPNNKPRRDYDD
ncbi:cell surface A33 antigen-like [Cheilinus undulatus]|uniref:cell surface A33 antigen-like n=1 Tax=Cheilinus undulatus TaxID=241271 RepID=UPI001BD36A94|nr:cell surface A33 antigen-like [Cheilinus undulatus]XP_041647161.1 cell surface A33 antigen-like [Cheilinus undulatus]